MATHKHEGSKQFCWLSRNAGNLRSNSWVNPEIRCSRGHRHHFDISYHHMVCLLEAKASGKLIDNEWWEDFLGLDLAYNIPHISHRCGNRQCIKPGHFVVEAAWKNQTRKACHLGSVTCSCQPRCLVNLGRVLIGERWHWPADSDLPPDLDEVIDDDDESSDDDESVDESAS